MNKFIAPCRFFLSPEKAILALCLLVAAGCATGNLDAARSSIDQGDRTIVVARESYASTGARADLRYAEEKLAQARTAYDDGKYDRAERLAQQAAVDAEYARCKAASEKARLDADRMRSDITATRMRLYPTKNY